MPGISRMIVFYVMRNIRKKIDSIIMNGRFPILLKHVQSIYPWDGFAERIRKSAEDGKLVVTNKNKAEQMLATIGIQPAEVSCILNLAKGTLSRQQQNVKYSIPDTDGDCQIC